MSITPYELYRLLGDNDMSQFCIIIAGGRLFSNDIGADNFHRIYNSHGMFGIRNTTSLADVCKILTQNNIPHELNIDEDGDLVIYIPKKYVRADC